MQSSIFLTLRSKLAWALFLIFFFLLLYWLRSILAPFVLALVLAYLLNPFVEYWEGRGLTRVAAIAITYLLLLSGALFLGLYIVPVFWRQLDVLAEAIPGYTVQLQQWLAGFYQDYQRINIPHTLRQEIDLALLRVEGFLTQGIGGMIDGVLGMFSYLLGLVFAPILAFYILSDQQLIKQKLQGGLPRKWQQRLYPLWEEIDGQLIRFIKGYLLVAVAVGLLTSLGFVFIGLDFPFLLGSIVGLAEIIPYFGPVIGAMPALMIAILHSKAKALSTLLVVFIIQQIESNILSPKIIGSSVGLHPLAVIFVVLLGNKILGILGMLLAIPLTLILRILWRHFYTGRLS